MKNEKYELIAKDHQAKVPKLKNAIIAFISGGIVGLIGEGIIELLCYNTHISRSSAGTIMIVILIFVASLSTATPVVRSGRIIYSLVLGVLGAVMVNILKLNIGVYIVILVLGLLTPLFDKFKLSLGE